jgi:hypothetical protein
MEAKEKRPERKPGPVEGLNPSIIAALIIWRLGK